MGSCAAEAEQTATTRQAAARRRAGGGILEIEPADVAHRTTPPRNPMSGDSPQGLVSPAWAGATPAPFLQVRDLEAALRERDDALEERTRMLSRAKAAVEQLHGELERTRREADESKGQVRVRWACALPAGVDHGRPCLPLCSSGPGDAGRAGGSHHAAGAGAVGACGHGGGRVRRGRIAAARAHDHP